MAIDAAGDVFVTEVGGNGNHGGAVVELLVDRAGLAVTTVSPDQGPGKGEQSITITGTGFLPSSTVEIGQGHGAFIGEVHATNVTVDSPTQITATTPSGRTGYYNVFVTSAGQTSTKNLPADLYHYRSTRPREGRRDRAG